MTAQPMALEDVWWEDDAQALILAFAKSNQRFTINELRAELREPPRHHNQWGNAIGQAKRRGVITEAPVVPGRAVARQSHGRKVTVWEAAPKELVVAA